MKNTINNISLIFLFLICASPIQSQNTSGINSVEEFETDGIKVILKQSPKEIISVKFYINGGTANYSFEQQGIDNFTLNLAMTAGTKSLDKIAFSQAQDKIGARISVNSDYDFSTISLVCVQRFWDDSWNIFSDAIMNPAFNEQEFNLMKDQLIAAAKNAKNDPDTELRNSAMANVFKGKNYAKISGGTEESLSKLSLNDIKNYYDNLVGKEKILIVIAGDISKKDISDKIKATFSKLPEGKKVVAEKLTVIDEPTNVIIDRDIETNYIRGYMNAPKMDSKEGVAMLLAMNILRSRLFIEIRTKRGLSYAPSAFYAQGIVNNPYNVIYLSTTEPAESIKVMVVEIDKLRTEGYTDEEIKNIKQTFLTQHYMGLETMSSQTSNLGTSELKGDWRMSEEFADIVNDITLDDINSAMRKYAGTISWTYLGKKDMINEEDFLQPKEILEQKALKK